MNIHVRSVPIAVAVEIQEPLAGRWPEDADLRYGRAIPVTGYWDVKLPSVGAFNNLIYQGVPKKFPKLRWSFVETTS